MPDLRDSVIFGRPENVEHTDNRFQRTRHGAILVADQR
jgi:hypothetical protein